MYYVYVLYSDQYDKFYIGYTSDLRRRIKEHEQGIVHTTLRMNKPTLVYYEACLSKGDATEREKQLKTGFGRSYLRKRVEKYIKSRV